MTRGCIAAADGWINRIRQVAPMCPLMRAHWRHLASTIELVLASAHPSSQPKWQINWFSHFPTTHGRVKSGMPGHVLFPNNCPFAHRIWATANTCFFGPTRVHNPNGISISSAVFAQFMSECHRACWEMSFPIKIALSHG